MAKALKKILGKVKDFLEDKMLPKTEKLCEFAADLALKLDYLRPATEFQTPPFFENSEIHLFRPLRVKFLQWRFEMLQHLLVSAEDGGGHVQGGSFSPISTTQADRFRHHGAADDLSLSLCAFSPICLALTKRSVKKLPPPPLK